MLSRRDFLAVAAATAAVTGLGGRLSRAALQQKIGQQDLLKFSPKGQLTILHMTDCHAQLVPGYYREPSVNIGVGDVAGEPPHVTGEKFLARFGIAPGSARAVAQACARNPVALLVPCHRVVPKRGREPGGYRFGAARKRALLELEGALRPGVSPGKPGRSAARPSARTSAAASRASDRGAGRPARRTRGRRRGARRPG